MQGKGIGPGEGWARSVPGVAVGIAHQSQVSRIGDRGQGPRDPMPAPFWAERIRHAEGPEYKEADQRHE